jgi:isopentenyl diphosphate isomerase/L-lactate dehydrogenase-like FMN-dependent dehydrogenase
LLEIDVSGSGSIINIFENAIKVFALGSEMVALTETILRELDVIGIKGVINLIINLSVGIKKIMFLTGSSSLHEFQQINICRKRNRIEK